MPRRLIEHLKKYIPLSAEEAMEIAGFFQSRTYAKKETLMEEGTMRKYHFFVVSGCLRMFFLNEKGLEQTTQFAIENWWLTDYFAFGSPAKSRFSIQAVEKTEVLVIDFPTQEKLLARFPNLERYFRLIYQRAYSALQLRTKFLYDFSREEFFHHFDNNFPEFTRRIPQHMLASYLNMTPEYLSEIKNKKRS